MVCRATNRPEQERARPPLSLNRAGFIELAHQALDGAAGHHDALAVELSPDLAGAVAEVLAMDACDLGLQLLVAELAGRWRP
jgi:hypothetical protein